MPAQTELRTLLSKLAARTILPATDKGGGVSQADFNINLSFWQWHQGVALYGLHHAGHALGDERYERFITDWIVARMAEGLPDKSINTTAPLLAIACAHEKSPRPEYEKLCVEFSGWCLSKAGCLSDGTYRHTCTETPLPPQAWADTLFMCCIFLAKWGRMTGDAALLDEAARQFTSHYQHLRDPETGLIYHGYDEPTHSRVGTLWGRGNGWYAVAATDVLELLGETHPAFSVIRGHLKTHLAGVVPYQDATGAWRTVMDEPSTYLEASCTAAFACAIERASAFGYIDASLRPNAARALDCLSAWINENGELTHGSAGTPLKPDAASYNAIPHAVTPFTQGLGLLAFARALDSSI